jgi:hypothetical protein
MIPGIKRRRHVARGWGWGFCQTCRHMRPDRDGLMVCAGKVEPDDNETGERPSCSSVRAKNPKCPQWKERR